MHNTRDNVFYPKIATPLSGEERLALRFRYNKFAADQEIEKICQHVFKQSPIEYQKIIAWGLDHILYDVNLGDKRVVVFRINQTSVEDDYITSGLTTMTDTIDWTDAISGDLIHDIAFWSSFYPIRINVSKAVLRHKFSKS